VGEKNDWKARLLIKVMACEDGTLGKPGEGRKEREEGKKGRFVHPLILLKC